MNRFLLIKRIAHQISKDVKNNCYEPLECLLKKIPDKFLISFLPEEEATNENSD